MSYKEEVLADSPVSYWRMDAASGTAETDLGSGGHNGTYSGQFALKEPGIPGGEGDSGVLFNSSLKTGRMEATNSGSVSGNWTVEIWAKYSTLRNSDKLLSTRKTGEHSFDIGVEASGAVHADIGNGTVWLTTAANSGTGAVTKEVWNHIVLAATETGYKIYVNGKLNGEGSYSGVPLLWNSEHSVFVAGLSETEYSSSTIDEVAIYSTALSKTRVEAHYSAGYPQRVASLTSYPPTYKTPRSLFQPFPFAVEEQVRNPVAIPATTLLFKNEISSTLKIGQKLSTTVLSKFESSGKLIVGYKLPSTTVESKLLITAPLKLRAKLSSTIESKFSLSGSPIVQYKLPKTTVESKFSIIAPLIAQYRLPKATLEPKFSLSAPLRIGQKLSSTLESKLSISGSIKTSVKLSSNIESKLSIVTPLRLNFNLGKVTLRSEFILSGQLLIEHEQEVPNLPERISKLKPVIPGPAVQWNWWLCKSSNLGQIAELTSAHSKNLQLMLNQPGKATFWLHLEDERTKYVEELKTCVVCYRNGKAIFSGPVFECVENADNTSNATLQVTAMGWFELLNHRIVHTGREWEEMLSKSGESYTPVATESALQLYYGRLVEPFGIPRNEIAVDLINRANIDVPTGITIGLNPEVSSLNYTVPQFHPVGELISQLTSIENSFDFKIDPLTRKFNIYYNQIKENSTIYGLGQDRGQGIRFTYPGNCIIINRSAYGTKTQNRTEAQGQYGVEKGESLSSISENGLFEKSESLTDVVNIDILIAYANIQTLTLEQPFKIITFNPRSVNDSESHAVPRPFEDYDIGDIVYATFKKGPRFVVGYPNPQPVRIFGLNLEIDDTGREKITQIQTVYSQ